MGSLMRTLVMQNSEEIILTRIQQLDASFIRPSFSRNGKEFYLVTEKNELTAAEYLASFLIFVLQVSACLLL